MLSEKEKRELFRKLEDTKREVSVLKTELNQIDEQKELSFQNKERYSREIENLIREAKEKKVKRDLLTKQVKEDKEKRQKLNEEIKKSISEIKKLNEEKEEVIKKHKIKEDPSIIRAEIEKLEGRIETDIMPFEKEKELMKRIKELKGAYGRSKEISSIWEKGHALSKNIDNLRKEAEEAHIRIQNRAKESQSKHEEMLEISKKIDDLREKEEKDFQKFIGLKRKFNEINEKLKEKLLEMGKLKEEVDKHKTETKKKMKEEEDKILKDKEEFVQEKIKKGEKLTTEDILVFQNLDRENE
ncbi:hypothetical protein J4209_03905 [Candidatus Woesearchaeota archaeon]|nr:hypothetical protein [Candidatus Woesearchaeota archaeon]